MISAAARSRRAQNYSEPEVLSWRVIRDEALPGVRNMALDHALASCLEDGNAVLRLYGWVRPTVSFGRNEPTVGRYSVRGAETRGIDYVRRPTGGRAVLHDGEVTYSVVAPGRALGGVRVAYRRINEALAAALRALGVCASVFRDGSTEALDAGPCFQSPVEGEIVARGKKLVGSAQARVDGVLLQHGSIVLEGDQALLGELQNGSRHHQVPATLREMVSSVTPDDVMASAAAHMGSTFGGDWMTGGYDVREIEMADCLEAERYGRDSWTWRR